MKYSKQHVLFILLYFTIFSIIAQIEITGFVKNANDLPIESANVVVYNSANNIIAYTYSKANGYYSVQLKPQKSTYVIFSTNSLGFQKKQDTLQLKTNIKKYELLFNLSEKQEILNEVVLKSTEKISRERSVITYKVDAFNNGTEQTIEDVLKNLPGIEVLKNGTIKAHGRFIDKLLIEGEDMFDKNYTLLSKNLDAKVLENVQILDKFEDNPILAKVIESEKVALNLVLKENYKNIWFGNMSFGIGNKNRIKEATNIGLIRKKIKFFNFNNYNNLGNKASEIIEDASTSVNTNSFFKVEDIEQTIDPIYSIQNSESTIFKEGQSTFNKAFVDALSFVTSLNSNLKIRGIGYFTSDNQNQLFSSETIFNVDQAPITYNEKKDANHKSLIAGGELELKYSSGEKSYLKNTFSYKNNPEKEKYDLLFNESEINEKLKKEEYSFNNHLNYSYLIGEKNILHSYLYFGKNQSNQKSNIISPILNNLFSLSDVEVINHSSNNKISFYGGKSTMLLKFGRVKSNIELGYESLKENRENKFVIPNNIEVDTLQNKINFKQEKIKLNTKLLYSFSEKIELSTRVSLNYINISNGVSNKSKWILNPNIHLRFKKLKIGYFSLSYNKNFFEPKSNLFLENYQLSSYQSFIKGTSEAYFPENNIFSFNYQITNDKKTKSITARVQYLNSEGKYSTENQIEESLIFTSRNFVDTGNLLSSNIDFTSYFKKMAISTNLGTSHSWSNTLIKANTVSFSNIKTYTSSYYITGRTYFKLPININFKVKYNRSASTFNNIKSKTDWNSIDLNLIYKLSEECIASLKNNFYFMQDSNFNFINFNMDYNPVKSKFSYQFTINNLANENLFSITEIDEYSTYKSKVQLLPRYVFILAKYRF